MIVLDNLSRYRLMSKENSLNSYNWEYLNKYTSVNLLNVDILNVERLEEIKDEPDVIFHTAAQTAVTRSLDEPRQDFLINACGTFNILELARRSKKKPHIV